MNKILDSVFKNKSPVYPKLIEYGFQFDQGIYSYQTDLSDGQMRLTVKITPSTIDTEVYDYASEDVYTLYLVEDAVGSFVGAIRTEYENALREIADKCFQTEIFQSTSAKQLIEYLRMKYHDELEFLWEKFSENAICRRKDNGKWYAVFCKIPKSKLGIDDDSRVEIAVLRMPQDKIASTVDWRKFYPAYHMNKKNWITVMLDGSVAMEEIFLTVDESYFLAGSKNKRVSSFANRS